MQLFSENEHKRYNKMCFFEASQNLALYGKDSKSTEKIDGMHLFYE